MFFLLLVLWVIFNGRLAPDVLIIGTIVSAAVTWFAMRYCKWYITKDWRYRVLIPRGIAYVFLLVWEVIKANLQVIRLILDPKLEEKVRPQIVQFSLPLKSTVIRMVLANSITLTPGTITVRLRSKSYVIHALTPEMGEGLEDSSFARAALRLDEATCKPDEEKKEENDHAS